MKISASHLWGYIEYARIKGIDYSAILDGSGISGKDLETPGVKMKAEAFYRAVRCIGEELGDDMLGLRVGQHLNLNTLGVIYRISLKAKNLMECLHYCHDYLRNTFPSLSIKHSKSGNGHTFRINVADADEKVQRYVCETTLTVMSREIFYASRGEAC